MTKKIEKKKFKDTKLGLFLSQKAPTLLQQVGDFLPDSGTLGIVKKGIEILGPSENSIFQQSICSFHFCNNTKLHILALLDLLH